MIYEDNISIVNTLEEEEKRKGNKENIFPLWYKVIILAIAHSNHHTHRMLQLPYFSLQH